MNQAANPSSDRFFLHFAWIILATVVVCFGAKAIFDADDLPPITPLHHLHAVSMLGWFFGRIPEIFDLSPVMAVLPLLVYQVAPLVHDRRALGRVHPACWTGFALMLLAVPVILGLSESPWWAAVLERLLGSRGEM
jgi:hypothetical protein